MPAGELPEWSNGADSKSVDLLAGPGVRIPHSPQKKPLKGPFLYFPFSWSAN